MADAPLLNNRFYNLLKQLTTMVLPGIATLYFSLARLWGFPKVESVIGSIAAANVFLGILVGISSKSYKANFNANQVEYDGSIELDEDDVGGKTYSLILKTEPEEIDKKKEVLFKVNTN